MASLILNSRFIGCYVCDLHDQFFVLFLFSSLCVVRVIIKIQIDLHSMFDADLNNERLMEQYINCQGFGDFDRYLHFSQQSPFMITVWLLATEFMSLHLK